MRTPNRTIRAATALAFLVLSLTAIATSAFASGERILHTFKGGADGLAPQSGGLTFDKAGRIYGATSGGGTGTACSYGCGTIFTLQRSTNGWTESVIYSFVSGSDGSAPNGDLAFDAAGNLYGTTFFGGTSNYGTVFELTHSATGWTETILHTFTGGVDGGWPMGGLVVDAHGNLYGTTEFGGGGSNGGGTVFELSPSGSGWAYSILHAFGNGTDGWNLTSRLTFDTSGNLYGTTEYGGTGGELCGSLGCGMVFELTPGSGNTWTENVLYNFSWTPESNDAAEPLGALTFDSKGNLYGTSIEGGPCIDNCGTVFELSPTGDGGWTEQVIFSFLNTGTGLEPYSGVAVDSSGNVYGTTVFGGGLGKCKEGTQIEYCGTLYKLTLANGVWTESIVHSFSPFTGTFPYGTLVFDKKGNLYGTTSTGGSSNEGVVYEFTP